MPKTCSGSRSLAAGIVLLAVVTALTAAVWTSAPAAEAQQQVTVTRVFVDGEFREAIRGANGQRVYRFARGCHDVRAITRVNGERTATASGSVCGRSSAVVRVENRMPSVETRSIARG